MNFSSLIFLVFFSSLACANVDGVTTRADSILPVNAANNTTIFRFDDNGEFEPAIVISNDGSESIDVRGHANVKSLHVNGYHIVDESGKFSANSITGREILNDSISTDDIANGAIQEKNLAPVNIHTRRSRSANNTNTIRCESGFPIGGSCRAVLKNRVSGDRSFLRGSGLVYSDRGRGFYGWRCEFSSHSDVEYYESVVVCMNGIPWAFSGEI